MGKVTQDQLDELDYSDKRNREKGDGISVWEGLFGWNLRRAA
jgi:hypothetical protein